MPYLACYDITSDKKRTKVSKILISYKMVRIQKSVFLGKLSQKKRSNAIKKIQKIISNNHSDKVYFMKINSKAVHSMSSIGTSFNTHLLLGDKEYLII